MHVVRAVGGIVTFIIGLLAFAGGLVVAVYTLIADGASLVPIDWTSVLFGALATLVGVGILWLSRAVGGEHGPIRTYPSRPIKRRSGPAGTKQ